MNEWDVILNERCIQNTGSCSIEIDYERRFSIYKLSG